MNNVFGGKGAGGGGGRILDMSGENIKKASTQNSNFTKKRKVCIKLYFTQKTWEKKDERK